MRNRAWRARGRALVLALVVCLAIFPAQSDAHLMPAQRGTLNFLGSGGFMVLSVPTSAFSGVDTNGDKRLSQSELAEHRSAIVASIVQNVRLVDSAGPRPLTGIMLSLSPASDDHKAPAEQLVVMGRFSLTQDKQANPEQPTGELFPSRPALFSQFALAGARHTLSGLDHLLFLLIVIAASIGWRGKLLVLTAFTVGHAVTLTLSVLGWVSLPPIIVEPAIAATIVSMAIFDLRARKSAHPGARCGRLCLVFACALIHGLGLASGLSELGLQNHSLLVSLAGFYLGIELAQFMVAALAGAIALVLASFARSQRVLNASARAVSLSAVSLGSFWLVARVVELG